mmetsp:Transcript_13226/g.27423  ORF Transcript_13226/g.27423 Transcript_13226/m.27423 type:complete len:240 (-) Transcript_13226:556-1275(-)
MTRVGWTCKLFHCRNRDGTWWRHGRRHGSDGRRRGSTILCTGCHGRWCGDNNRRVTIFPIRQPNAQDHTQTTQGHGKNGHDQHQTTHEPTTSTTCSFFLLFFLGISLEVEGCLFRGWTVRIIIIVILNIRGSSCGIVRLRTVESGHDLSINHALLFEISIIFFVELLIFIVFNISASRNELTGGVVVVATLLGRLLLILMRLLILPLVGLIHLGRWRCIIHITTPLGNILMRLCITSCR